MIRSRATTAAFSVVVTSKVPIARIVEDRALWPHRTRAPGCYAGLAVRALLDTSC
jgi:hypothetical protein